MMKRLVDSSLAAALTALALTACFAAPLGATCSEAAAASNSTLAASFPGDVESLLIVRAAELDQPGSLFRPWLQALQDPKQQSDRGYDGQVDQGLALENRITRAGIHTMVWAGSRFVAPEGVGASRADFRKVYVTVQSLDPLARSLQEQAAQNSTLESGTEDGIRFFRARNKKRSGYDGIEVSSNVYLAFADSCTAVLTESLPELVSIINNLRDPRAAASRWSVLSKVDATAPLLILRDVKPPLLDGTDKRLAAEQPFRLAMTLRDPAHPQLAFAVETPLSKRKALRYFREVLLAYSMGEDGYRLTFKRAPEGFKGQLEIRPDNSGESYPYLVALWLFGMWMNI